MGSIVNRPYKMKPHGFDYSDERYKALFANFGQCSLKAQVIEYQLYVIITATRYLGAENFNVTVFRQTIDADRRTMGRLITELKAKIEVPANLQERLEKALDDRNYLIHRFFMSKELKMGEVGNIPEMNVEVISIGQNFEVVIRELDQVMEKLQKIAELPFARVEEDAKNIFKLGTS